MTFHSPTASFIRLVVTRMMLIEHMTTKNGHRL